MKPSISEIHAELEKIRKQQREMTKTIFQKLRETFGYDKPKNRRIGKCEK
jgi:hypothetical protein